MVAARDDIHAGGKYFFGRPGGYARTAGGILPVRDDKIQGEPFPQPGQEHFDGAPSRFSDDITNKKQIHAGDFSANPGKNTQEYAKNRKDEEVSRGDAEKNETEKRAPIPFSFGVMIQRFQR
jgi:hypothetical protein